MPFVQSFVEDRVLRQALTPRVVSTVRALGEFKGKQDLWKQQFPEVLASLLELAVIQSTESSSRIEGVTAAPERFRALMQQKTTPAGRSEEEIAGYRDALGTVHAEHEHLRVRPTEIRGLHASLFKFTAEQGGQWKTADNEIAEVHGGKRRTRFRCVSAVETPAAMQSLCDEFARLRDQEAVEPLLLIPAFVLDFLCVHPFRDGNGRIARLLSLLLLYQSGYEVGRYISLERIIEQSKESYYDTLRASSQGWHEGRHDLSPWRDYFLGTVVAAYRELERREGMLTTAPGAKRNLVQEAVRHMRGPFSISELERVCPSVSRDMIRLVLNELREQGEVESGGRGRAARWCRIT
jgi:Fic family protein